MTIADERPSVRLRSLVDGFQVSQALYVVATLNIGDLLRDGPRTAKELANEAVVTSGRSIGCCVRLLP
jgi:hypothetical protein